MRFRFPRPSGDLMWISLAAIGIGIYWCIAGFARELWLLWAAGLVTGAVGIGIWFEQAWARWAGLALMAAAAVYPILRLVNGEKVPSSVVTLFGVSYIAWMLWKWPRRGGGKDKPLTSLVLLLRQARGLNRKMLAEGATAAWGTQFGEEESAQDFVAGESPVFLIKSNGAVFMVHNHARGYFDDTEKAAAELNELRLSNAIREHTAWMAVDLMDGGQRITKPADAYPEIARLVAELSGPDCVAIFCPETGAINVYDSSLEEKLRGPDPLSAVREPSYAPVVSVSEDDPRMKAAVAEARERWPEFAEAFGARRDGQIFGVKAPITKGGQTEFIWIKVSRVEGQTIYGHLDNDPVNPDLKCGDAVEVPRENLNDWAYSDGEKLVGPFTLKVLEEAAKERRVDG